jgi:hypothetical protein
MIAFSFPFNACTRVKLQGQGQLGRAQMHELGVDLALPDTLDGDPCVIAYEFLVACEKTVPVLQYKGAGFHAPRDDAVSGES